MSSPPILENSCCSQSHTALIVVRSITVYLVYFLVACWVLKFSTVYGNATVMWLPAGIGLASLILWGRQYWPLVFLGGFSAGLWANDPVWASLTIAAGNTLESLSVFHLLARMQPPFNAKMNRARDFLLLLFAAMAGATISAVIGPTILLAMDYYAANQLPKHMLAWWQSDVIGIVIATPFLLTWRQFPKQWFDSRPHQWETALFFIIATLTLQILFLDWQQDWFKPFIHTYWSFALIVWSALRFDKQGTTLLLVMIALFALTGASQHQGVFADDIALTGLQNYWFYQLVATLVGTLLVLTLYDRKQAEQKLQLAALVYENSSEAMMVTDPDNRIISVNPAFTACTGYSIDEVFGKKPNILKSGLQDSAFYQGMWQSLQLSGRWEGEIYNRRKNGDIYVEWLIIDTIFNAKREVVRRVAMFHDITEDKKKAELIWLQANYDPLTELPNRRLFTDRLQLEMIKAERDQKSLAVLFIDLDHFKNVNDSLGHDIGDNLLIEISKRLSHCVRKSDTVARLGGDEFVIILTDLGPDGDDSANVAQSIIDTLQRPLQLAGNSLQITASIGIAIFPVDASSYEDLLRYADQAMYASKRKGRNSYCYFSLEMQQNLERHLQISMDLRKGIAEQQFELYYQPIVELVSGGIHKAEALVRWHHPKQGLIGPGEFIAIAEETGDINPLGEWIFEQASRQLQAWRRQFDADFQISINKSPAQFHRNHTEHQHWSEHLGKLGLPGNCLVVEITEGLLMNAQQHILDQLLHFSASGIQVAIDDFGTGYSSLAYLERFDIDYLKIDQMFTRKLEPHSKDLALVEAIVVMAHKLGLKVIAEGIESRQQLDILLQIGCDYGQGYLFAKPLPVADFERLLANSAMKTLAEW